MSRARRLVVGAALGGLVALVACDLNPQPLPPLDPEASFSPSSDAGSLGARDAGTQAPPAPNGGDAGGSDDKNTDAGTTGVPDGGGPEADGGEDADAGDAGDAG